MAGTNGNIRGGKAAAARQGEAMLGAALIAGAGDTRAIGRTVDKLAGGVPEVQRSPIDESLQRLGEAVHLNSEFLEGLAQRLERVLIPANANAVGGNPMPPAACELDDSLQHLDRRVRTSNERILDLLHRLAL